MSIAIKEIKVSLAQEDPLHKQPELYKLSAHGWQVVLINPQRGSREESLICNIQLIFMN
ncbi:MAG: hypothetical protein AAF564_17420 [Bacteroidota bacterium]